MQPISSQTQPPIDTTPPHPHMRLAVPQISIKKTDSSQIQSPKQTKIQNKEDNRAVFEVKKVESLDSTNKNSKQRASNFRYSLRRADTTHRQSVQALKNETKFDRRSVSKAIQQSLWQCPYNLKPSHQNCKICKGTGRTSQQSPLIKFFLYVLNYKLGQQKDSSPHNLSNSELKQTKQAKKQANYRFRLSTYSTSSTRPEIAHYGYYCNGCGSEEPIIGVRYNCFSCEDYDLCDKCFQKNGHQHRMDRIEVPVGYLRAEQMVKSMKSTRMRGSLKEANHRLMKLQQEMMRRSLK